MGNNGAYAADGVNVTSGDRLSAVAKEMAMKTYDKSPFVVVNTGNGDNYFRAPVSYELRNLPDGYDHFLIADGIGTKVGLYSSAETYDLAAFDLMAMVVDDAARNGRLPLMVSNVLSLYSTGSDEVGATDEQKYNFSAAEMIYSGLCQAALTSRVVLMGGETAEKGVYVGGEVSPDKRLRFDMEAVLHGVSHPDKLITGATLAPKQVVIALKEHGFRSNGISSVRATFKQKFGEEWWNNPKAKRYVQDAAQHSVIYSPLISTLNGWYAQDFIPEVKLHAVAHITGEGIEGKFWKDFLQRRELSANLNHLFEPPEIMKLCWKWRGMSQNEAYATWNGGQGMLLVVDNNPQVVDYVIEKAKSFGIIAQPCGSIEKWHRPQLVIKSKFTGKNTVIKFD